MDLESTNRRVIAQYRAGGDIPGMHRERLLLLTTVGARTSETRTAPMMFVRDADRIFVIASNAGARRHPDWYRNLVAHPRVTVEVGDERYEALARPLSGAERDDAWTMITERFPFFLDHAAKAGREIPVVELTRA